MSVRFIRAKSEYLTNGKSKELNVAILVIQLNRAMTTECESFSFCLLRSILYSLIQTRQPDTRRCKYRNMGFENFTFLAKKLPGFKVSSSQIRIIHEPSIFYQELVKRSAESKNR